MANKKRKYLIKLNNKIRNFFDGLPFEEGITQLADDRLVELSMLLELELLLLFFCISIAVVVVGNSPVVLLILDSI